MGSGECLSHEPQHRASLRGGNNGTSMVALKALALLQRMIRLPGEIRNFATQRRANLSHDRLENCLVAEV